MIREGCDIVVRVSRRTLRSGKRPKYLLHWTNPDGRRCWKWIDTKNKTAAERAGRALQVNLRAGAFREYLRYAEPTAEGIQDDLLYGKDEFLKRAALSEQQLSAMRKKGLTVLCHADCEFVHGGDFINFLRRQKPTPRLRASAVRPSARKRA